MESWETGNLGIMYLFFLLCTDADALWYDLLTIACAVHCLRV